MLRFLFGGLATVAGLVLLFVASFGDPTAILNRLHGAFPTVVPERTPVAGVRSGDNTAALSAPAEHAASPAPPSQPQPTPPAVAASQPRTVSVAAPPTNPGPSLAPSPPPGDDTARLRAQREALQQQLQRLQEEMAQASQNVSALHSQADQERRNIDALQQQRATAEGQVRHLDSDQRPVTAQPAAPTADQTPAPAPAADQTPAPAPAADQTPAPAPAAAQVPLAQESNAPAPLPLPPPLPPNPPQQARAGIAAAPSVSAQHDAWSDSANGPGGGGNPQRPQRIAQSDFGAMQSALERLRHAPAGVTPQSESPLPGNTWRDAYAAARPAVAEAPRQAAPRARLSMARAALEAGRVDEARQYLEQAQLQLVFRPITPTGEASPAASGVASDVASALSMLGAGNANGALQYLDRAMSRDRPGGYPPAPGYDLRGPYGGPPMADADR